MAPPTEPKRFGGGGRGGTYADHRMLVQGCTEEGFIVTYEDNVLAGGPSIMGNARFARQKYVHWLSP